MSKLHTVSQLFFCLTQWSQRETPELPKTQSIDGTVSRRAGRFFRNDRVQCMHGSTSETGRELMFILSLMNRDGFRSFVVVLDAREENPATCGRCVRKKEWRNHHRGVPILKIAEQHGPAKERHGHRRNTHQLSRSFVHCFGVANWSPGQRDAPHFCQDLRTGLQRGE